MIRNRGKRRITAHVKIKCPECGTVQNAIEEEVYGIDKIIYFHKCKECFHEIMADEWNVVDRKLTGEVFV